MIYYIIKYGEPTQLKPETELPQPDVFTESGDTQMFYT